MKNHSSLLGIIRKPDVDFDELQLYIRQMFKDKFGEDIIVEVEATQYGPYPIGVTVYVKEEKDGMWDLCLDVADALKGQGIQVGIHTELAKEVLNEV